MITTTKRMRRINHLPKKGWKKMCDKMNHLRQIRANKNAYKNRFKKER